MYNESRFELSEAVAGVGAGDAPALFKVRQRFERPVEHDIAGTVRRELEPVLRQVKAGQSIAITGSSRGIVNLAAVLSECAAALTAAGASPFVVPGMGSHGGATDAGQAQVLADAGITEDSRRLPDPSSMEVVQIGTTETGFPGLPGPQLPRRGRRAGRQPGEAPHRIHRARGERPVQDAGDRHGQAGRRLQDSPAEPARADGPPHPGCIENHRRGRRPRLLGGLAIVENAYKETALIKAVDMQTHAALVDSESELLRRAYALLPRIPFDDLDALVVDEMGKNISGSGMDSNVIGKKPGLESPRIGTIYVRGLTDATHGNATGIGYADLMPRKVVEELDLHSTYMNAFTAKRLSVARVPMLVENDLQAMQIMLNFRAEEDPASLRMAWIQNTSKLEELWVSSAVWDEANAHPNLEVLGAPLPLRFSESLAFEAPAS